MPDFTRKIRDFYFSSIISFVLVIFLFSLFIEFNFYEVAKVHLIICDFAILIFSTPVISAADLSIHILLANFSFSEFIVAALIHIVIPVTSQHFEGYNGRELPVVTLGQ